MMLIKFMNEFEQKLILLLRIFTVHRFIMLKHEKIKMNKSQ